MAGFPQGCLYIDGEFVPPVLGESEYTVEKGSGDNLAQVGIASEKDVNAAYAGATRAYGPWMQRPFTDRADLLRSLSSVLESRREDWIDWLIRETGCVRAKAQYELDYSGRHILDAAGLAGRAFGQIIPSELNGRRNFVVRRPMGCIGVITPWNFPLLLAMYSIAPAIALGNTVVLKPAPATPVSGGLLLADMFHEAGFPAGVVQVLTGSHPDLGALVATHTSAAKVQFTGSTSVGRLVASAAGATLKRVGLELGGNNAFVVLGDAPAREAARVGASSTFGYQGQSCIAAGRHLVDESIADEYARFLVAEAGTYRVGDPLDPDTDLGPMISLAERDRVLTLIDLAREEGAELLVGKHEGWYLWPTVLRGVAPSMSVYHEEIFGPVATITTFESDEEAIALVNNTGYGLVNSVITADPWRGFRLAERVASGMVHVNEATAIDDLHCPFGGWRESGIGRLGGDEAIDAFTQPTWISVRDSV